MCERNLVTYTAKTVNYWGAGENLEFGLDYWTGLPIVDGPSWKLPENENENTLNFADKAEERWSYMKL